MWGAVDQAYYPVAGDEGHELVAQVIALNASWSNYASHGDSPVAWGTPNTPYPFDAVTTAARSGAGFG